MRTCGDCQLCCKLLPVAEGAVVSATAGSIRRNQPTFDKPAGERCPHQRHHKGCAIYQRRPLSCRLWTCRWLTNNDTADLHRPDRTHYVLDQQPDFVTITDNETGAVQKIEVVQIWCDPDYPNAHRDPNLRRYLERRALEGIAALVRFDSKRAITVLAPILNTTDDWVEIEGGTLAKQHTAAEIAAVVDQPNA